MLSYWEKTSFLSYDYLIIGGGIVGFSTAISIKEKHPKAKVLVLEKGILPSGASTKNAGFACFGSLSELVNDLKYHTEQQLSELLLLRYEGLQLLRKRLGDNIIQYEASGSYELIFEQEEFLLEEIQTINQLIAPLVGENTFSIDSNKKETFGFSKDVKYLIKNKFEGAIHTGKMMSALIQKAQFLGVEYRTGVEVKNLLDKDLFVEVDVCNQLTFKASKVFICNNAFVNHLLPKLDVNPGRGQVLITKPINNLAFKGVFHFDGGYYYFREIDGRVLLGGGRNLDFQGETSTELTVTEIIQNDLEHKLRNVILPNTSFEIDMRWSGIMAFGQEKMPLVNQISKNVFYGVRLGGMGVAIGSKLGQLLVEKIT